MVSQYHTQNTLSMSKSKLVKKLDAVFSKYIRWKYADDNGYVECYTCNTSKHVKEMQCGHFQSRRHYSTRWQENNVRPQCVKCNMFEQGNQYKFGMRLRAEIGEELVEDIIRLSVKSVKMSLSDYQELHDYYKHKLKELTQGC